MNDLAHAAAYAVISALVVFLSRIGIVKRVKKIEEDILSIKNDQQTAQTNMKNRMEAARMEFRSEVDSALVPVNTKLDNVDSMLGELTTMVSSMVNKAGHEQDTGKQPE